MCICIVEYYIGKNQPVYYYIYSIHLYYTYTKSRQSLMKINYSTLRALARLHFQYVWCRYISPMHYIYKNMYNIYGTRKFGIVYTYVICIYICTHINNKNGAANIEKPSYKIVQSEMEKKISARMQ